MTSRSAVVRSKGLLVSVGSVCYVALLLFCDANSFANAFMSWPPRTHHRIRTQGMGRTRYTETLFLRSGRGRPLFMTSASSSTSSASMVVYQKIVRPSSSKVPPALFLANLVEFLQDHFELPSKLPMTYEKQHDASREYVVSWDSPLSSSSDDTRLNVQVVAIYTQDEQEDDDSSLPSMAMVVVNKAAAQTSYSSSTAYAMPMMQNLFAESERQILRALDRGLDDVQRGRIQFTTDSDSSHIPSNVKTVQGVIDAEMVMDDDNTETNGEISNDCINGETDNKAAKSRRTTVTTTSTNTSHEDYAVVAAKKAMAERSRKKREAPQGGEFAVEAAKRAATARTVVRAKKEKSPSAVSKKKTTSNRTPQPALQNGSKTRIATPRRFTISTRKERAQRGAKKVAKTKPVTAKPEKGLLSGASSSNKHSVQRKDEVTPSNDRSDVNRASVRSEAKKVNATRALNLSVDDMKDENDGTDEPLPFETILEETKNDERTVSQTQMEHDIMEAAKKAMSEIEDAELTPEELLHDVMKFGEEKEQENAAGMGFVSGAFEKAKELLRKQKQQRDQRIAGLGIKEAVTINGMRPDILDPPGSSSTLSAEDELKRIFNAGERLADDRLAISKSERADSIAAKTELNSQEEVDSLIAGENTVSGYARSLDDELAELEVRINKSPGEELDGPVKNPIFDVFSGPEVFNPNVDPETAVNWPGAQPGTKDLRLPKELDEAVKQAKFAAEVLTKMEKIEESDGSSKFFLGGRELKPHQVENVRAVVSEAVEIGLIDDPLEYLSERSRMQMVVDEMWGQPVERHREIASNFKDLLLSDNFVPLIKERLEAMAERDLDAKRRDDSSLEDGHVREREILGHLVEYAQLLLKEARALGAELEASQLEIVRTICQVAMDPSHKTEEETANALTDAVRDMRPLLDDVFVAYLKYAVAEEEGRLARAGLLDDPEHNEWLFVLKIVQQGVYTEIARGINRYIEHIFYVLRMKTRVERRMLLSKIIDSMPTMDVRPFVQVVDKIVASLGHSARGEFDGYALGEMTNKILQLRRDVKELLPPERIQLMSRDADEWAAKQKQRLLEQRKVAKQRLKAAQDTTYDEEIRRRGEMERM